MSLAEEPLRGVTCEVCGQEPAVVVHAVPAVPYSACYGVECLRANAHPLWSVVANTACCGGRGLCDEWWLDIVEDTCKHLGLSLEDFDAQVEQIFAEEEAYARHHGIHLAGSEDAPEFPHR